MKKLIVIVIIFFFAFISCINAKPINNMFKTNLEIIDDSSEDIFDININVNTYFNLHGFIADLLYDKNRLEILSCTGENGFSCLYNDKLVISNTNGMEGNYKVATIKFKNNDINNKEKLDIELQNIEGAFNTIGVSSNVTLFDDIKETNLLFLKVDGNDILNTLFYKTVNESVMIEAEVLNGTILTKLGKFDLKLGENEIVIEIESENKEINTYKINIIREKNSKIKIQNKEESPTTYDNIYMYINIFILSLIMFYLCVNNLRKNMYKR